MNAGTAPHRRKHPIDRQVYAKFAIEAARNAAVLRDVATAAAEKRHYGVATALEVLALEEAAKSQALGTIVLTSIVSPDSDDNAMFDRLMRKSHRNRHEMAAWQGVIDELVDIVLRSGVPIDQVDRTMRDEAFLRTAARTEWLRRRADAQKQRGLYVDLDARTTPSELTRADYEEAVGFVEPYVTMTLQQAGLVPPPAPRAGRPFTPWSDTWSQAEGWAEARARGPGASPYRQPAD